MSEDQLSPSAKLLAERLTGIIYHLHDQLDPLERAALSEACRRVSQHERLVLDVLPNLRRRLTEAENPPTRRSPNSHEPSSLPNRSTRESP